jgi:hypothetical protein
VEKLALRDGFFRRPDGAAVYLIGANFWPHHTGPWMYRDAWDENAVASDLAGLSTLGANVVRIFCFLPDFMPAPDVVAESAVARLAALIDLAARHGLWSIPTFLVGHMSGENWAPAWAQGRNWYTDAIAVDAAELLAGTIAARFCNDPRIAAWLLTNEWPLFAGHAAGGAGVAWAERLVAVVRAADPATPVSLGDGAWDVIGGQRTGLHAARLRNVIDFYGPHFYPKESDALRHSCVAAFAMRMLAPLGRPVLLEEFGCSSDQADDELAADYYRTVLWSALGAGACGALAWNSHDFTTRERPPYSHHPYELHFGLIRTDGSHKPQAEEFARCARFARAQKWDDWVPCAPDIAIARTSYYLGDYPFDWGWTPAELRALYLQTYASLAGAGLDAAFSDLPSLQHGTARLAFAPCLQQVTTFDARALERFAYEGGTVYLSYGGEPWYPDLGRACGSRLRIRYGLTEEPPGEARLLLTADLGDLRAGTKLHIEVRGDARRAAGVRCEPTAADVVAVDESGSPVLLVNRLGAGRVIFCTLPLEYYYLHGHEPNGNDGLRRLYRALALAAGVRTPLRAANAPVQPFLWRHACEPGLRRIMLVNHGWVPAQSELQGVQGLRDCETGESLHGPVLMLEPKAVRIFECTASP